MYFTNNFIFIYNLFQTIKYELIWSIFSSFMPSIYEDKICWIFGRRFGSIFIIRMIRSANSSLTCTFGFSIPCANFGHKSCIPELVRNLFTNNMSDKVIPKTIDITGNGIYLRCRPHYGKVSHFWRHITRSSILSICVTIGSSLL